MRAPPPHRKSLSLKIPLFIIKLKKKIQCNNWKQKKRIRKLHRIYKSRRDSNLEIPGYDIRVEDSYSIKTEYLPSNVVAKPLLIATFRRDCKDIPQINILERSKMSQLHLLKRKFKLKLFNYNLIKISNNSETTDEQFRCVSTIRSIKNLVDKDADVRPIFHNKNILRSFPLKTSNYNYNSDNLFERQGIRFCNNCVVNIDSFPYLRNKKVQNVIKEEQLNIQTFNREIQNDSLNNITLKQLNIKTNINRLSSRFRQTKKHKSIKIVYHSTFIKQDNLKYELESITNL